MTQFLVKSILWLEAARRAVTYLFTDKALHAEMNIQAAAIATKEKELKEKIAYELSALRTREKAAITNIEAEISALRNAIEVAIKSHGIGEAGPAPADTTPVIPEEPKA